ncbi:MAG: YpdA family putative bacillithiol disulfide reductase [Chitinophagales bacterium]
MEQVIIIGAGPCGLAVAIELKKRGIDALILEKGSLTNSIRNYPRRMRFFSTADNIEIGGLPFPTSNVKADRTEALQYYRKAAAYFNLRFKLFTEVISYKKEGQEFIVKTSHATYKSRHLIIATGYFQQARKLNIEGEILPHVSSYYDEPYKYSFSKVAIIGGANSAIEAALELYRHNVEVHMIVRKPEFKPTAKYWLVPDIKNRIKEGKIKVHFNTVVEKIEPNKVMVKNTKSNTGSSIPADFVFSLIGYLPETAPLTNAGVEVNPETLVPKFDKNTFETNVPKLYLCGTIIAGKKTESVFIENGRDHAVQIAQEITGLK